MLSYANLFRSIQGSIASYQDIGTIYGKLETQGHLYKLTALIAEVFEEEHEFTLNELKKYAKEPKNLSEKFIQEQYELNSGIFRRNLALIAQNIVDETGRFYLQKFKLISQNPKLAQEELNDPIIDNRTTLQKEIQIRTIAKMHNPSIGTDLPEIREETENDKNSPSSVKRHIIPDDQPRSPIDSEYRPHLHQPQIPELEKKRRSYGHIQNVREVRDSENVANNSKTYEVSNNSLFNSQRIEVNEFVTKASRCEPQSPIVKNKSPNVSPHPSAKKERPLAEHNANVQIERSRAQAPQYPFTQTQSLPKLSNQEKARYRGETDKPWDDENKVVRPYEKDESDGFFFQSVTNSRENSMVRDGSNFFSKPASPAHNNNNDLETNRMKSNRSNSGDFYSSKKGQAKNSSRPLVIQQSEDRNIPKELNSPTESAMHYNTNPFTTSYARPANEQGYEHEYASYKNQNFSKQKKEAMPQKPLMGSGASFHLQDQIRQQQHMKDISPRSTFGKSPKQNIFAKAPNDLSGQIYYASHQYVTK